MRSEEFCGHWAAHNVRLYNTGVKHLNHPSWASLLSYNRIELPADPGLAIITHTPERGSRSAQAFSLLVSWAATEDARDAATGDASAHEARPDSR